jgi:cytoskeletal protein RodZ
MKIRGTTVVLIAVVVILLVVAVIANINTFKELGWFGGKSKPKPSEPVVKQSNTDNSPSKEITPAAQKEENKENSAKSTNSNWRASLSPALYGRPNPFIPLRGSRSRDETKKEEKEETVKKEAPGPLMQVTAVLGSQAIIKVNSASKTVSAGDALAGMEVVSIEENEVILRKGDDDYTITLGEEPKHVPPGEAE